MDKKRMASIALFAALAAIATIVALKVIGYENPTVIGGGVAGGIAGAISGSFLKKRQVK